MQHNDTINQFNPRPNLFFTKKLKRGAKTPLFSIYHSALQMLVLIAAGLQITASKYS
jgi:hypothetical protein